MKPTLLAATFSVAAILAASTRSAGEGSPEPAGLMVHLPFDGAFTDKRALGSVRPEVDGIPVYVQGALGQAAMPGDARTRIGSLHVSRLSRIMLLGRTPAAGTIMLWLSLPAREAGSTGDTTSHVVLSSDAPLNLEIRVTTNRLTAGFDDSEGTRHKIEATIGESRDWVHIALGWDSGSGRETAFVDGEATAESRGAAFKMPGLPRVFALGAPGVAIDEFRLYNRHLEPNELAALPGM